MSDKMNKIPEISQIEEFLRSTQPVPGATFHHKMAGAPWNTSRSKSEGVILMKRKVQMMTALAGVLVLLVVFAFTPPGRVLADKIIHFFNPASGTSFPLPPDQVLQEPPTITPEPTREVELVPADEVKSPTPQPTAVTDLNLTAEQKQDLDSMTAQYLSDLPLLAPGALPQGFRLSRISYDDDQQAVVMEYISTASDAKTIQVVQGKNLKAETPAAGTQATQIRLHEQPAQIIHEDQDNLAIEWKVDGLSVVLRTMQAGRPVLQDDLVKTAESMSHCKDNDYVCQVQVASTAAGFTPWQFPQTPPGMSFKNAYYTPDRTSIWFGGGAGELGINQSGQDFTDTDKASQWFSVPEEVVQKVTVAGQPAEYVEGGFINKVGEDHATWDPNAGMIRLRWKNGDSWFEIVKWGEPVMQPQELADLAGQLKENAAITEPSGQQPAETSSADKAYDSIDAVQKAAGVKILEPSVLPEGLPFSHARIFPGGNIMLFYGDFDADKMRINGPSLIINQGGVITSSLDNVDDMYPPEAVEQVQVSGHPAKIIHGSIMTSMAEEGQPTPAPQWISTDGTLTLFWETDDGLYMIQFSPTPNSGARLNNQDLIDIAESLH
jgi:hypothetical protein